MLSFCFWIKINVDVLYGVTTFVQIWILLFFFQIRIIPDTVAIICRIMLIHFVKKILHSFNGKFSNFEEIMILLILICAEFINPTYLNNKFSHRKFKEK